MTVLRLLSSKVDKYIEEKRRKTIYELFEENLKLLGLLKPTEDSFKTADFRAILLSHKIHYIDLIDLIIEPF
jgi:hypothetical protein